VNLVFRANHFTQAMNDTKKIYRKAAQLAEKAKPKDLTSENGGEHGDKADMYSGPATKPGFSSC
jgi:hypothetical protein